MKKERSARSSCFKGVSWSQEDKKWKARVCERGLAKHLGYFKDEIAAAEAYDTAAKAVHGRSAFLNFPEKELTMETKNKIVALPEDMKKALESLPALAAHFVMQAKIEKLKFDAYLDQGFSPEQALFLIVHKK